MKKLHFEIFINAQREKVWNVLIGKDTYPQWTAVFGEDSNVQGSWDEGEQILFVAPDEEGKLGGMASKIAANRKPKFLSIKHIGLVHDGEVITEGKEVEKWASAYENYTLKEKEGGTLFVVDTDVNPETGMIEYFEETWPKALKKLKEFCEE